MKTSDFYYDLPERLIAQTPVEPRDAARMMVIHRDTGLREDRIFRDLPEYLRPGDVMVINQTKVIPARLLGEKEETHVPVEVLLLKRIDKDHWETLVRPGRRLKKGVTVCNAANYSNQTVAELVIGMTIGLLRKMPEGDAAVRNGGTSAGLRGKEIAGRTVGVIGTGRIGMIVAKLFLAFGAKVISYDVYPNDNAKALGIEYVALDELMARSDIVTLHTPNNASTRGLISRELIRRMQPHAIFINCARGPIVDNKALADALNEGVLAGAAIDVYDMEPPIPSDYPLLHAKNIMLTPHVAFLSDESMIRRAHIAFNNTMAYLNGKPENVCQL